MDYTKEKGVGAGQISAISSVRETAVTTKDTVKGAVGIKSKEEEEGKDRALGEAKGNAHDHAMPHVNANLLSN